MTAASLSKVEVEQRAAVLIDKAKARVMMQHPLWSALLMRLRVRADWRARTMYTDAKVVGYNPEFVIKRTIDDLVFIFVHEVVHCALGHPMRARAIADRKLFNEACDHAGNLLIARDPRLVLPADALADKQFAGLNAEVIYAHLYGRQQQQQDAQQEQDAQGGASEQSQEGQGKGDDASQSGQSDDGSAAPAPEPEPEAEEQIGPGSEHGDIIAPGEAALPGDDEPGPFDQSEQVEGADGTAAPTNDQASDEALLREWQEALSAAALGAGDEQSEVMERKLRELATSRQSFAEVLAQFLTQRSTEHDDWGRRNRRFSDIYMPSRGGVGMKRVVFGIDTSMSISERTLSQFRAVVQRVFAECSLQSAAVIYCDTQVRRVDEYDSMPEFESAPGGGGTRFAPVFQMVQERMDEGDDIACVVFLTDQDNTNSDKSMVEEYSSIPTLWVNPGVAKDPPFGDVCSLRD